MKAEINHNWLGTELIVTAENVKIQQSLSEPYYELKENGKPDFDRRIGEDITDENMKILVDIADTIVSYREREYDMTNLVLSIFEKLPDDKAQSLLKILNKQYLEE